MRMFMLMDALRRTPCVKLRVDMESSVACRVVRPASATFFHHLCQLILLTMFTFCLRRVYATSPVIYRHVRYPSTSVYLHHVAIDAERLLKFIGCPNNFIQSNLSHYRLNEKFLSSILSILITICLSVIAYLTHK